MYGLIAGGSSPAKASLAVTAVMVATAVAVAAVATLRPTSARAEAPPAVASAETAVWTPKELRFTYLGFTSRYSCDGLRDKILRTLLKLGARKQDLQVNMLACPGGFGRPQPFPGVTIKMNVLQPVTASSGPASVATVPAHWQAIDFTASRDPLDVAGDCELIEQIKERILPLFAVRNVDYRSTCVPYQLSVGGTQLKLETLIADPPAAAPAAASQ